MSSLIPLSRLIVTLSMYRLSHRALKRPIPKPQIQRVFVDAESQTPISQTERFATPCNHAIASHVSLLFRRRCPSRIRRFIVSVFVRPSVNRMFRRWFAPHVRKEVLKTIPTTPAVANCDSPSAVHVIFWVFRIVTTIKNVSPCRIFYGSFGAMTFSMRARPLANSFSLKTSARLNDSLFNNTSLRGSDMAAYASTSQFSGKVRSDPANDSQNSQSPVSIADHRIIHSRSIGRILITQVIHLRNRLNCVVRPVESFSRFFGLIYCSMLESA